MISEPPLATPVFGATHLTVRDVNNRREFTFATIGGDWTVSGRFRRDGLRLHLRQLSIEAPPDQAAHLTARLLHQIPIGAITNAVQGHQLDLVVNGLTDADTRSTAPLSHRPDEVAVMPPPRRGRPPRPDTESRRLALAYLDLQTSGASPLMETLAAREGAPLDTVRGWIRQLTRAGWLAPATNGKPGRNAGTRLLSEQTRPTR